MDHWAQYNIYAKLRDILAAVSYEHHFGGRPFVTAYQLAIEFDKQYPTIVAALNLPIGGEGTGRHNSLSQYLAHQLSIRIKSGTITDIQGGFLGNLNLNSITFNGPSGVITSSLTGSGYPVSIFRLTDL
jgi:hypothetical protein